MIGSVAALLASVTAAYVALGSSFAAGYGLGPRAPGSPRVSQRSINGYPQQLTRLLGMSITDMTSSGSTTRHVLFGGQFGLGAQIDAVTSATRLVTLTAGGNDMDYVGGLMQATAKNSVSIKRWITRLVPRHKSSISVVLLDRSVKQMQ